MSSWVARYALLQDDNISGRDGGESGDWNRSLETKLQTAANESEESRPGLQL